MQDREAAPAPKGKRTLGRSSIRLSVPWGNDNVIRTCNGMVGGKDARLFITERTRLHETYVRETAKNRRVGLLLGALLLVVAAGLQIFAPSGRETMAHWLGAALVIFAAGSCGYGRVWGRASNFAIGADTPKS